jgi:SAM-dependent methyltransferase
MGRGKKPDYIVQDEERIALNLMDIIHRQPVPKPWAEGEKIPWNEPEFSKRMLHEHLSQAHDAASRRFEIIDKHVDWIHHQVLKGNPARILDLGCGPGLYANRLARLGHHCVGIDFSPASIAYAREQAEEAGLDCKYFHQDIRQADFGEGFGLVMSIFGELNVFLPAEAKGILANAWRALVPDGFLLLEPHTFTKVAEIGGEPHSWYSAEKGLFSDEPHLFLQENFWDAKNKAAIQRYYVIDAATGGVTFNSSTMQAYTNEDYRLLLAECGFTDAVFYPSLGGSAGSPEGGLIAILSRKRAA